MLQTEGHRHSQATEPLVHCSLMQVGIWFLKNVRLENLGSQAGPCKSDSTTELFSLGTTEIYVVLYAIQRKQI